MPATLVRGRSRSLILTAMILAAAGLGLWAAAMTGLSLPSQLVMAGIMAAAVLIALTGLRAGRQEEPAKAGTMPGSQALHEEAEVRP